jgi:hypothetical protein
MTQQLLGVAAPLECHGERLEDQFPGERLAHRPPHYAAAEEIEHHAQIQPPDLGPEVGDV